MTTLNIESINHLLTLETAKQWQGAENQQDFCDDLTGWERTEPGYWANMDLLEDAFEMLIEDAEQPVQGRAES